MSAGLLHTREEIWAAALSEPWDEPLTQEQADRVAAILAPWLPRREPQPIAA